MRCALATGQDDTLGAIDVGRRANEGVLHAETIELFGVRLVIPLDRYDSDLHRSVPCFPARSKTDPTTPARAAAIPTIETRMTIRNGSSPPSRLQQILLFHLPHVEAAHRLAQFLGGFENDFRVLVMRCGLHDCAS